METSLHRQLKHRYAGSEQQTEVAVAGFRVDAISESGELIEIQHASLGALRDKTRKLLSHSGHHLRIVKPIVGRRRIVTLTRRGGTVKRQRMSPKQGAILDLFEDLVHFSTVFPQDRLTLEMLLIDAEETRVDRKLRGWRKKKYRCLDIQLLEVRQSLELRTLADLLRLLPLKYLPVPFDTAELAAALQKPRWFAQKVAYCLRQTGAAEIDGKRGNSQLYRVARRKRRSAA